MSEAVRPIIIRRKKVYAAAGHHGGAWKVAYADFVTAMMAFFLLMWLLNATTEEQRKGIADYFNPNIPIAAISGGGSDALNGDSIFAEEIRAKDGTGALQSTTHDKSPEGKTDSAEVEAITSERIEALNAALQAENSQLAEHVMLKMSPEGLVIELVEGDNKPLFSIGNSQPSDLLIKLISVISDALGSVNNDLKIVGHTDSRAYISGSTYSNWDLSTDRAHTARRLLMGKGFKEQQIVEVAGKADTDPVNDNPLAAQNRRISITLLKQ